MLLVHLGGASLIGCGSEQNGVQELDAMPGQGQAGAFGMNGGGNAGNTGSVAAPGAAGSGTTVVGGAGAANLPAAGGAGGIIVDDMTGDVIDTGTGQVVGTTNGVLSGTTCFPLCVDASTDLDPVTGVSDGFGFELGRTCVVAGSAPTVGAMGCTAAAPDLGSGEGFLVGALCFPPCRALNAPTDAQGYGFEFNETCIAPGSPVTVGTPRCEVVLPDLPVPGEGFFLDTACFPACTLGDTGDDVTDGFGFEFGTNCIVPGSATADRSFPCIPELIEVPDGANGLTTNLVDGPCFPVCGPIGIANADPAGFGTQDRPPFPPGTPDAEIEAGGSCIAPGSTTAQTAVACVVDPLPAPPGPPAGAGWQAYTVTAFGADDCDLFGFDEPGNTDLQFSTCIDSNQVTLAGLNQNFFGALGDRSTLWGGGQECLCNGQQTETCGNAPSCAGQTTCGDCFEVTCNGAGTVGPPETNGDPQNRFCQTGQSVVIQIIDACPHNHPNNPFWCTDQQPNHIDVSCSALDAITQGRPVGEIGYTNVFVRPVDCGVGLGARTL